MCHTGPKLTEKKKEKFQCVAGPSERDRLKGSMKSRAEERYMMTCREKGQLGWDPATLPPTRPSPPPTPPEPVWVQLAGK